MWKIKHKNWALLLSNAIFVILCLICLIGLLRHPYIGLALENTEETWRVITVDPYGEGARSSIRKGDIILQMDDLAPEQHSSVQKWHEVVDVSVLTVQTPGEAARTVHTVYSRITALFIAILPFTMSYTVILKRI